MALIAVAGVEADVEQDDVGLDGPRLEHRVVGGRSLSDHAQPVVALEQPPQPGAHDRVIVDDEYANADRRSSPPRDVESERYASSGLVAIGTSDRSATAHLDVVCGWWVWRTCEMSGQG